MSGEQDKQPPKVPERRKPSKLQRYSTSGDHLAIIVEEEANSLVAYRSIGLGIYGAALRFVGMPLEKIALFSNSTKVTGSNQLQQAVRLTFQDGMLSPWKVVGRASFVAWFLQYSVMGFVFQACDATLSSFLGTKRVAYGHEIMHPPTHTQTDAAEQLKYAGKTALTPLFAGVIESVVSNRAEVQRYYGIEAFGKIEKQLGANPVARVCGPAFAANAARNFVMSSTSFVLTPTLYQLYFPQERKSHSSLFWFGLGMNIFVGNVVAITQQALWGRALDDCAVGGGRHISYRRVVGEGLSKEGVAAFFTPAKWFSRVLMNAPAQGTIPWFYNQVLPIGERPFITMMQSLRELTRVRA
eukprot:Transcript_29217.p1 GENE.Transcript_29217~~Transcript_29217.p1  ORF type:complete len:355 (+),score=129.27 Transcript_29217:166-1230(+)